MVTNTRKEGETSTGESCELYDTVLMECGGDSVTGILLVFHHATGKLNDITWGRVIEQKRLSELHNWNRYPYVEYPGHKFYNLGFKTTMRHARMVLVEKNIVESFEMGFDSHVNMIAMELLY